MYCIMLLFLLHGINFIIDFALLNIFLPTFIFFLGAYSHIFLQKLFSYVLIILNVKMDFVGIYFIGLIS